MWKTLSAIGQYTGVVSSSEQPPYPCAWPLKTLTSATDVNEVLKHTSNSFSSVMDLYNAKDWSLVRYNDPEAAEGGDLRLFSRPRIGTYHMVKATMSIRDQTPEAIVDVLHNETLEGRKRFSADMTSFTILDRPTPTTNIHCLEYWAPPPVVGRDFCFAVEKKVDPDGTTYVWGCSIDYHGAPKNPKLVRGACMWGWIMTPVGPHTLVTYVSCLDPRGWAPSFLIAWLKTAVAKELIAARGVLYGKEVKVEQEGFDDIGMTKEEIEAEIKKAEKQQAKQRK